MLNPYVILAATIAFMVAVAGAYIKGRGDGGELVRGEWASQALTEANTNAAATQALQTKYREQERQAAVRLSAASRTYQVEKANHETTKLAALAGLESGALRLRLSEPARCEAAGNTSAETAARSRGFDGSTPGEFLGPRDSAFLVALASEADSCAAQVAGLQAVVRADRQ